MAWTVLGCGVSSTPATGSSEPNLPVIGQSLSGKATDGQQPITGAHVYLLAANTAGYGKASVSLLESSSTGYSDSVGAYVLTGQDGSFSIAGTYSCPAGSSQVYVYVQGGSAGPGVNPAIGELAAIGNCPSLTAPASAFLWVNEVSTVAMVFATAGFATSSTSISSSGTPLAQTGIANAFTNAGNLASLSTGAAYAVTPSGYGTVPQSTINTLANILEACVHSSGSASSQCSALFSNTAEGSTEPTDTATAAINIAHHPAANVAGIYALQTSAPPFTPALTAPPNDFSIGLTFTAPGINSPKDIAVDSAGNVWLVDEFSDAIIELAPNGAFPSGPMGYTAGLYGAWGIAIDTLGNAWVANGSSILYQEGSIVKLSSTGSVLSGSVGFTGGGMEMPTDIAVDPSGNIWVTNFDNSVSKLSSAGEPLSPSTGFIGGNLGQPGFLAIDPAGNVWVANGDNNSVTKLSSTGEILSGPTGFTDGIAGDTGGIAFDHSGNAWVAVSGHPCHIAVYSSAGTVLSGPYGYSSGPNEPYDIAIDGAGNIWTTQYYGNSVAELSPTGAPLSGVNGYTGGKMNDPEVLVIDGSGNIWVPNYNAASLTELVGIATPVVTPLSAAVKNNTLGTPP